VEFRVELSRAAWYFSVELRMLMRMLRWPPIGRHDDMPVLPASRKLLLAYASLSRRPWRPLGGLRLNP
jgi:hypothetical protein